MALTSAGLESKTARAMFDAVVVEVSYFALDMAVESTAMSKAKWTS